jgi:hypothetical protein
MRTPRLTAIQAVSRLRRAEAAAIAKEGSQCSRISGILCSDDPLTEFFAALAECEAKAEKAREFDNAERLAEIDRYSMARRGRNNPHGD